MERFSTKLNTLRKQSGLTQKQLSDILEVSESFVWKLENGKKTPNASMLVKIAKLFQISLDKLMIDELELDD